MALIRNNQVAMAVAVLGGLKKNLFENLIGLPIVVCCLLQVARDDQRFCRCLKRIRRLPPEIVIGVLGDELRESARLAAFGVLHSARIPES